MKIEFCKINKDILIHTDKGIYFIRNILFGKITRPIQMFLYKRKIYWHNWLVGEFTPFFECCQHKVKNEDEARLMKSLIRAKLEQQPIVYFNKLTPTK